MSRELVINMTDDRKMVVLSSVNVNLVKWVENLAYFWNPCVFKDMIDFRKPMLQFIGAHLKFCKKCSKKESRTWVSYPGETRTRKACFSVYTKKEDTCHDSPFLQSL